MGTVLLVLVLSYLVGSIPTSIIVSKSLRGIDIRNYGSGNAGATNVYRVLGLRLALLVLAGDAGKGLVAVLLLSRLSIDVCPLGTTQLQVLAGLVAIAGHIWAIFAGFRGGKGVGTAVGVFFALAFVPTLIALIVWLIVTFTSRYVSLGSITAAVSLPLAALIQRNVFHHPVPTEIMVFTLVIAILILITHRSNVKRLLAGTENRFGREG